MNIIFLILLLLWSGCGLLYTDNEADTEPEVNEYFQAELNGEQWSGEPTALITMHDLTWLTFNATRYDTIRYPYNDHLRFALHFNRDKSSYTVLPKKEENNRTSGGEFVEIDGDATIARYNPIPDSSNSLSIEVEEDENENKFVTGTFTMTVVVREIYDKEPNNSYRQYPDTVRIINGKFRVLLEEQE